MEKLFYLAIVLLLVACQSKKTPDGVVTGKIGEGNVPSETANVNDYTLEAVPGTNWQKATKLDSTGNIVETGFFEDGKKVGTWVNYGKESNLLGAENKRFPSQVATYKDGKLNGIFMQFNEGGQAGLIAYYQNNLLNGNWGKYQFGRASEEAEYKDGKLNGEYKVYELATGRIKTSAEYKNGIQDGYYRNYNDEGQVIAEYLYKDGKAVSGGAVTPGKK